MGPSRRLARTIAICGLVVLAAGATGAGDVLISAFSESKISRFDRDTRAFVNDYVTGINSPHGMLIGPDCNLYVSSINAVYRFSTNTEPNGTPLPGATGAPGTAEFVAPGAGGLAVVGAMDFGPDGHLYVANGQISAVQRFDGVSGAYIDDFVPSGSGGLSGPALLHFGPDGDLYVPGLGNDNIMRYDGVTGAPKPGDFGTAGTAEFVPPGILVTPHDLDFGPGGNLYVNSYEGNQIYEFDKVSGAMVALLVPSISAPHGISFGPSGTFFVASLGGPLVEEFADDGTPLGVGFDGTGILSTASDLVFPPDSCGFPVPVPDGTFGSAMKARRMSPTAMRLFWDVSTCQGASYHLLYGALGSVSSYILDGARCDLGPLGQANWSGVPAGDLWFVIVTDDDDGTEGSWGRDSNGTERSGPFASGLCNNTQRNNTATCP